MRHIVICLFLMVAGSLAAQNNPCSQGTAFFDLHVNNIKATVLNGGDLFANARFIPNPDAQGLGPSTIYSAGLWVAGLDPGGNLHLAASGYRSLNGKTDYYPGPLVGAVGAIDQATCANWDKIFHTSAARIKSFRDSLFYWKFHPDEAVAAYPDIMGWPGPKNPHFEAVWGFEQPNTFLKQATFLDFDDNAIYDALKGDYPAVLFHNQAPFVPTAFAWCTYNDNGAGASHTVSGGTPLNIKVDQMVWAFQCDEYPVLNNTIFTLHSIYNLSSEPYDSTRFGIWADFDLGCENDDYVGSLPGLNTFFVYNQDMIDGQPGTQCGQTNTFGVSIPVQTVTFLQSELKHFIATGFIDGQAATQAPESPIEYYHNLNGRWRDNSPIRAEGNGFNSSGAPSSYLFPGDPGDPSAWTMCSAGLATSDLRALGSTSPFLGNEAGALNELVTAWSVHPNVQGPCSIGDAAANVSQVLDLFNNGFWNICRPFSNSSEPVDPGLVQVFPNPTSDDFHVSFDRLQVYGFRLFDADGRLVMENNHEQESPLRIAAAGLSDGMYRLQIFSDKGVLTKTLGVLR